MTPSTAEQTRDGLFVSKSLKLVQKTRWDSALSKLPLTQYVFVRGQCDLAAMVW